MKNPIYPFLMLLSIFLTSSCEIESKSSPLIGLWEVSSVQMGDEQMTPQGRWVEFMENGKHNSGNGWIKHSEGKYDYNAAAKTIFMGNTFGIKDEYGPFTARIEGDQMFWTREEDGNEIKVSLRAIQSLPTTDMDLLQGLWKLETVSYDGVDLSKDNDPDGLRYLNLRWDKVFVDQGGPDGRLRGPYRIHAHMPEIEFVYYGDPVSINTYSYKVNEKRLVLSNDENGALEMTYKRIHTFPSN